MGQKIGLVILVTMTRSWPLREFTLDHCLSLDEVGGEFQVVHVGKASRISIFLGACCFFKELRRCGSRVKPFEKEC